MAVNPPPPPNPIRLVGRGPFETPTAVSFLGLVISPGVLPARLSFVVQGDKELRIPADQEILETLRDALNKLFPPTTDEPE